MEVPSPIGPGISGNDPARKQGLGKVIFLLTSVAAQSQSGGEGDTSAPDYAEEHFTLDLPVDIRVQIKKLVTISSSLDVNWYPSIWKYIYGDGRWDYETDIKNCPPGVGCVHYYPSIENTQTAKGKKSSVSHEEEEENMLAVLSAASLLSIGLGPYILGAVPLIIAGIVLIRRGNREDNSISIVAALGVVLLAIGPAVALTVLIMAALALFAPTLNAIR